MAHTYETLADKFAPFTGYKGAISVAMGDFDGDGNDELITAKAAGAKAQVKVWNVSGAGNVGVLLDKFVPFPTGKNLGVSVAAGDLDNDGRDELIVGAGPGGPANVAIYRDTNSDGKLSDNTLDTLRVFAAPFKGGVKVAAGNVNNTGGEEVVVGMWTNGGTVATFTDANANRLISDDNGGAAIETFTPFGAQFLGGVNVASGEIQSVGNGGAEVIVGSGAGKPKVRIFTDTKNNGMVGDEPRFDQLKPGGTGASGAAVAVGDTDNSSFFVEVLTGPAAGSGAHVKIFDDTGDAGALLSDNAVSFEFDAFGNITGGLNLAFGKVQNATFAFNKFPQTIQDSATLTTSIFVPAGSGRIVDLDVSLSIFHSFDGDLDVTLTHVASGTSVVLFQDVGGTNEGFFIRLNDEAGTDISGASNPKLDGAINGTFNPGGAALLSTFDGLDLSGEWRLSIVDDSGGDTGTLFTWSLLATV
jgi:subtilisin-like proprotein convertase family protein